MRKPWPGFVVEASGELFSGRFVTGNDEELQAEFYLSSVPEDQRYLVQEGAYFDVVFNTTPPHIEMVILPELTEEQVEQARAWADEAMKVFIDP